MLITVANQKGGCGKTTIAIHLAHAIALAKKRVLLVDADPQGSAGGWAAVRGEETPFVVVGMARETLHRDLPAMMEGFDHGVIDSPPRVSALSRSAILASDLTLIPVQPSSYDAWAAAETVGLIKEAQQYKPELIAAFVVNRRIAKSSIGREITEALSEHGFPILGTAIAQRVIFAESSGGLTVIEMEPSGQATSEVKGMARDILKLMGVKSW